MSFWREKTSFNLFEYTTMSYINQSWANILRSALIFLGIEINAETSRMLMQQCADSVPIESIHSQTESK